MKNRIPDSNKFNNVWISGRIEYINDKYLCLANEKDTIIVFFNNLDIKIKPGDLVSIYIKKKNNNFYLKKISILNSIIDNPVKEIDSPYYKLHRKNRKLLKTLYNRQNFFLKTRQFFIKNNFLEIQTPALVESPGIEYHIEPFETSYININGIKKKYFLPTSPEFSLKKALSGGLENIFEIAKVFRNHGEDSDLHNPEFFMLEWYRAYSDYYKIMDDCKDYIQFIGENIYNKNHICYKDKKCHLNKIDKIKLKDIFLKYNINLDNYTINENIFIKEISDILKITKKQIDYNNLTKEDLFFKFLLNKIEPNLGFENPAIIYEYPVEMANLSKISDDSELYADRFELYICGIEIANAFGELTDPADQKRRFDKVISFRNANNKTILNMPKKFIQALKFGIPPCSGIALGLERLFMLFEGLDSIKETNLF